MSKNPNDLGSYDVAEAANAGAEIELVHPITKLGLGQFVGIVGQDSDAFRAKVAFDADEERRKEFLARRRNKVPDPIPYSETLQRGIELMAACVTSFRCASVKAVPMEGVEGDEGGAYLRYKGAKLTFSEANAIKFLSDPGMAAFKKQIDGGIVDLENFMKV